MTGDEPPREEESSASRPDDAMETSVELLRRAQDGESQARNRLIERYLPAFRNWARGRLPQWARGAIDTEDLVQDTLLHTIQHLPSFEPRGDGALQAYMRQALRNRIRDEVRRAQRHGQAATLNSKQGDGRPSPSQEAVAHELLERYERGLERLDDKDREAIVSRLELGQSWQQVAVVLAKPSPDAARMAVSRALRRLVEEMAHETRARPHR